MAGDIRYGFFRKENEGLETGGQNEVGERPCSGQPRAARPEPAESEARLRLSDFQLTASYAVASLAWL